MAAEKKKTTTSQKSPAKVAKAAKASATPSVASAGTAPASKQLRRLMVGEVVSDKMNKTIVVKVDRRVRHSMYLKYVVQSQRYKAHDENNSAKVGDRVEIIESRPLSKDKRWALRSILRKAVIHTVEANV